jgi:ABC-2 type transport system ATP-binding protein
VAYLAQSPVFYRDLTVRDHLDYVAHYRGSAFDKGQALQRMSELGVTQEAKASTLSGGQAAQLGLAIAFGMQAEVILLDEPLAALDPLARRAFIDVLRAEITKSGATAVLSSHIVSDIERACNRLIVLSSGTVQIEGAVSQLIAEHTVVPASTLIEGDDVVSELPDGRRLCRRRLRNQRPGSEPALEDLVLGYLAAGKSPQ